MGDSLTHQRGAVILGPLILNALPDDFRFKTLCGLDGDVRTDFVATCPQCRAIAGPPRQGVEGTS